MFVMSIKIIAMSECRRFREALVTGESLLIHEVQRLDLTNDSDKSAYGILVKHAYGEDMILSTLSPQGYAAAADDRWKLRGQFDAASWRNGKLERMTLVGGTDFAFRKTFVKHEPIYSDVPVSSTRTRTCTSLSCVDGITRMQR